MTTEALQDFANAVQTDTQTARGLVAAISRKQGEEAADAFAAYAQEQGFAVTPQDAAALQAADSTGERTLSDDELEGVAGGNFFRVALGLVPGMMVTVGTLAGAAIDAVIPKNS